MNWEKSNSKGFARGLRLDFTVALAVLLSLMTGCSGRRIVTGTGVTATRENLQDQAALTGMSPSTGDASKQILEPATDSDTNESAAPAGIVSAAEMQEPQESEELIYVHIFGQVNAPGVYAMHPGDRVFQVIDEAGGFTQNADRDWINLAGLLSDMDRIQVYSLEETAAMKAEGILFGQEIAGQSAGAADDSAGAIADLPDGTPSASQEAGRIDLNTADAAQLMTLPGIGQRRAEDILAYRSLHGKFTSVEELKQISGIGEKLYAKIAGSLYV